MFSPVHVILPFSDIPPAEAIRAWLAPYRRGGKSDVPEAWLAFHDETEHVRALHRTEFVFTRHERGGAQVEGEPHWLLDIRAVNAEMARRDLRQWRVRFIEVEPDVDPINL